MYVRRTQRVTVEEVLRLSNLSFPDALKVLMYDVERSNYDFETAISDCRNLQLESQRITKFFED